MNPRRVIRIVVLLVGLPCVALVVCVAVSFERDKSTDMVVFDNLLTTPVAIAVDGEPCGDLEPAGAYGSVHLVKLPDSGNRPRKITASSAGKVIAEAVLATHARADGENGYRGLFTVGGRQDYAIATVPYVADDAPAERPTLVKIDTPAPLTELPRALEEFQIESIDTPFLDSQTSYGDVVREIHLCRMSGAVVGCSGFPSLRGVK